MNDPPLSPHRREDSVPVILLTGAVGAGKTTTLMNLVRKWLQSGKDVRGIIAHRVMKQERVIGYDLEVIGRDVRLPLARKDGTGSERIGPFVFSDDALAGGRRALKAAVMADIVVIDEFGPLELKGGGWAEEIKWLAQESNAILILVVREPLLEQVRAWLKPFERPIHSFTVEEVSEKTLTALISRAR